MATTNKQELICEDWLSCVFKDAAIFTGVDNTTKEAEEQLATNRVHGRRHRKKELLCETGHTNDY